MTSSNMLVYLSILVLVSISAIQANEQPCRCFPDQMSGRSVGRGMPLRYFYDYSRKLRLESYGGMKNLRNEENGKRYSLRGGFCEIHSAGTDSNDRCVPDDAELVSNGATEVSYQWQYQGRITVKRTMSKSDCVLKKVLTRSSSGRTRTGVYRSRAYVNQRDLDLDLSNCH